MPISVVVERGITYVLVNDESADNHRRIPATEYNLTWGHSEETCYYIGNSQGGPELSHNPCESVIEGAQSDYATAGLFETHFPYKMFDELSC